MQKIIEWENLKEVAPVLDSNVYKYIGRGETESFEGFDKFNLMSFDLCNVKCSDFSFYYHNPKCNNCSTSDDSNRNRLGEEKTIVYMDDEDLIFICEDRRATDFVRGITTDILEDGELRNETLLYRFFAELLKGDMDRLDKFEERISESENSILEGDDKEALTQIIEWRRELLRLKHYYEQLDAIFDEIQASDKAIISDDGQNMFRILGQRTDRYLSKVYNLQEMVGQLRETYQSQLSIEQNDLMKFFTIITAIFLPLTLITGWFGMNFKYMPEFSWPYAYPCLIGACIAIIAGLVWYFKHKKWL